MRNSDRLTLPIRATHKQIIDCDGDEGNRVSEREGWILAFVGNHHAIFLPDGYEFASDTLISNLRIPK